MKRKFNRIKLFNSKLWGYNLEMNCYSIDFTFFKIIMISHNLARIIQESILKIKNIITAFILRITDLFLNKPFSKMIITLIK